ncbi:MAG TPA: hypothetical protein PLA87_24240, partial [Pseudomonadota bacterium]|nr:hypothetical protein [Pseudomonadota bacterium]
RTFPSASASTDPATAAAKQPSKPPSEKFIYFTLLIEKLLAVTQAHDVQPQAQVLTRQASNQNALATLP